MRPTLAEAVAALGADGVRAIRVVPVFFGQGSHVKEDLPRLVSTLQAARPDIRLTLAQPIGEDVAVIEAIAAAIAQGVN
jgi:sirohydrochlorin cobaltochelatase